jgi:hypothetical protein
MQREAFLILEIAVECQAAKVSWSSRVLNSAVMTMLTKLFTCSFSILVDTLNNQLVYLANLATMILINLLYRRFDNFLRTISEIVTRGIVLAIREREKEDKKAG